MRMTFTMIAVVSLLFGCASAPPGGAGVTGAAPANWQAREHHRRSDGGQAAPARMSMCEHGHMMKGMPQRGCGKESQAAAEQGSPDGAQEHGSTDAPHDHGANAGPAQ